MPNLSDTATGRLAEQASLVAPRPGSTAPPALTPAAPTGGLLGAVQMPGDMLTALGGLTPDRLAQSLGLSADTSAPPVDKNYQRNLTTLTNKYAEMAPQIAALPEHVRNALIQYDSTRVAKGSAPMTREQTLGALETIVSGKPHTPPPDRSILNPFKNITSDLGDILKSLPRLPVAIGKEILDIPNIGTRINENEEAGMNPIAAILKAPGIRMIPGTYVVGNVAQGGEGLHELATHPLMTALDVLPAASKMAAGTEVAKIAEAGRLADPLTATRKARPLTAVLTGRVLRDEAGNLVRAEMTPTGVEGLGRNRLGNAVDTVRNETTLGQALDSFGGKRSRDEARVRGRYNQRYQALFEGYAIPETARETLAHRAGNLFSKYEDQYEFLKLDRKHAGPEWDQQRAEFYDTLQRNPDALDPGLVGEYRDLMFDAAKELEADGKLGMFDDEWYDAATHKQLVGRRDKLAHAQRMNSLKSEYLNPSGTLGVEDFRNMAQEITNVASRKTRGHQAWALEQALDAYGVDVSALKSVRSNLAQGKASPADWATTVNSVLDQLDVTGMPAPRRTMAEIIADLRTAKKDVQAGRLEDAVARGDKAGVTKRLKNLYSRKDAAFNETAFPGLRDDIQSMTRRTRFDSEIGKKFTQATVDRAAQGLDNLHAKSAPARFHGLLADDVIEQGTKRLTGDSERVLGRALTADEAGQVAASIMQRRWQNVPGLNADEVTATMRQIENEVTRTWRDLKAAGADPLFVHKVSPARANTALAGNINPVPVSPSAAKERVLDLSPGIKDVQVSLRHQAGEMLQQEYNERYVTEIIDRAGRKEADLRDMLADEAVAEMTKHPSLDFEAALEKLIKRRYEPLNMDEAGHSWGGVKLKKFRQDTYYIPKALAANLKAYSKPPSVITSVMDPMTKAFRYNVIGLSPSVVVNNFFSNAVTMTLQSGLSPWKYWAKAQEWTKNPGLVPLEELKAMFAAEQPNMEYLNRDAFLKTRVGKKIMAGRNSRAAFEESAAAEAVKKGKSALDGVVEKSLTLQRMGDNVYRAMQYMDEVEKAIKKGATADEAAARAMKLVQDTFVDYRSFTPIERSAMRSLIPFYSYMGHAARFIMRYPLDHPMRASIVSHIADAERDRLGSLPGSYLSMIPLPDVLGGGEDSKGGRNMLALRPFDPFGDISDMTTVSGWLSATNPVVQTALEQAGLVRGEADLYPTMRFDPVSGRMKAVHPNPLMSMFNNTVPRAGALTTILGINPQFNEVAAQDPDAAKRMLLTMGGIPRAWRKMNPIQDTIKTENARKRSADEVLNDALKSGDWSEALTYPSLREAFTTLRSTPADQLTQYQAASKGDIANTVAEILRSQR